MALKYKKEIFFFIFIFISIVSCKNKETKEEVEINVPAISESADFQDFYNKFSADSLFQLEHIVFPLEGMKSQKDSLDIPDPAFRWTLENWVIHHAYDDMNGTYIREFFDIPNLVIEKISDTSGQYSMERRFAKLSSGWHLIYYREMGKY